MAANTSQKRMKGRRGESLERKIECQRNLEKVRNCIYCVRWRDKKKNKKRKMEKKWNEIKERK